MAYFGSGGEVVVYPERLFGQDMPLDDKILTDDQSYFSKFVDVIDCDTLNQDTKKISVCIQTKFFNKNITKEYPHLTNQRLLMDGRPSKEVEEQLQEWIEAHYNQMLLVNLSNMDSLKIALFLLQYYMVAHESNKFVDHCMTKFSFNKDPQILDEIDLWYTNLTKIYDPVFWKKYDTSIKWKTVIKNVHNLIKEQGEKVRQVVKKQVEDSSDEDSSDEDF